MTSFYEASTSGMNFDRFAEDLFGESARLKVKQTYWTAKQLLREKLGKREDEHLLAADAELDLQLQQFNRIRESSKRMLEAMDKLQNEFSDLTRQESGLAEFLADCPGEKEHLQRVLQMSANAQRESARQRQKLQQPINNLCRELDDFMDRAVFDCEQTVEAIDRARLEYRGSLLWMKKQSETLDPEGRDSATNMEDFRTVQNVVKLNKRRLDQLKEDIGQKVALLKKARSHLLEECLAHYRAGLEQFYDTTAAEYSDCAEQLSGLESYEIDVLKILNDPIGAAMEKQKVEESHFGKTDSKRNKNKKTNKRGRKESENDESMVELEEVEEAEVCEPEMDRVRELLRFDQPQNGPSSSSGTNENWLLGMDDDDEHILQGSEVDYSRGRPADGAQGGIGRLNLLKHSDELSALESNMGQLDNCPAAGDLRRETERQSSSSADLLAELDDLLEPNNQVFKETISRRKESDSPLAFMVEQLADQSNEHCEIGQKKESGNQRGNNIGLTLKLNCKEDKFQANNEVPKLPPPPPLKEQMPAVRKMGNRQEKNGGALLEEMEAGEEALFW